MEESTAKDTQESFSIPKDNRRPVNRLITVEPVIILFNLALFASTPLQIQYIHHRLEEDLGFNSSSNSTNSSGVAECGSPDSNDDHAKAVQEASAFFLTVHTICAIVPCLFTTLIMGSYSDKACRKRVLVPGLCGDIFRVVTALVVIGFRLSLWSFTIGLLVQGLVGGAGGVLMSCYSYLGDVTTPKQRGFRLFILELCTGTGQIVAQAAIGESIAAFGFFWPYLGILAVQIAMLLYALFILPESRMRRPDARLLTLEHYKRAARLYTGATMRGKRLNLALGLVCMGLFAAINMVNTETLTLYLVSRPLCWESTTVGYYNAVALGVKLLGSLVVLRLLIGRVPEEVLALGSIISLSAADLVVAFATKTWIMFLSPIAGLGSQIADAMVRSITSKLAGPENQGALFSSQIWCSLFSAMLGTIMFNAIYASSTTFHGLVFLVAAALYVVPFTVITILHFRIKADKKLEITDISTNGIENPVWNTDLKAPVAD